MEDVGGGDEVEAEAEDEVGAAVVVEIAEVIREVVQQDKTIVGRILLHHLRKMLLHSQNEFNNVRKLALEWRRKVRVGRVDSTCLKYAMAVLLSLLESWMIDAKGRNYNFTLV